MIIPFFLCALAFAFLNPVVVEISITVLGLLSFALHKLFINKLSEIFIRRRYDIMEDMF
jgi:hypothetical protein